MVPCNNNFVFEVKPIQNIDESDEIFFPSMFREITGMNKNVTLFLLDNFVQDVKIFVSVRYSQDLQFFLHL